jgi:hypothetical protein
MHRGVLPDTIPVPRSCLHRLPLLRSSDPPWEPIGRQSPPGGGQHGGAGAAAARDFAHREGAERDALIGKRALQERAHTWTRGGEQLHVPLPVDPIIRIPLDLLDVGLRIC